MSHQYYHNLWRKAQLELDALVTEDTPDLYTKLAKEKPNLIYDVLAALYIRYLQVYRKFESCLDQIIHPQKRLFLRQIVENVIGRLQELKHELVELEQTDVHCFYTFAQDMGYSIPDLEVPIPRFLVNDFPQKLTERDELLRLFKTKTDALKVKKRAMQMTEMPASSAAATVLLMERSRQAWQVVEELVKARKEKLLHHDAKKRFTVPYGEKETGAVRRIQAFWKGVKSRRIVRKYRKNELQVLQLRRPDKRNSSEYFERLKLAEWRRQEKARQNEAKYKEGLVTVKEQLKALEGPVITNQMESQIRQWFVEYRDATGKFPDFPSVEDGGSASLFTNKDPRELAMELDKLRLEREQAEAEAAEAEQQGGKGKGKKGKTDKKKSDKKDAKGKDKGAKKDAKDASKAKGKGKKGKDDEPTWTPAIPNSSFTKSFTDYVVTYHDFWEPRTDQNDVHQDFDADIVRAEKRKELHEEIRPEVDENMRKEIDYLRMAIDGQKPKKAKKKKKKGKKGKKGKKEKDLTPDRTIESIFEELSLSGVISTVPKQSLDDYLGSGLFVGEQLRQNNYDFDVPFMPQAEEIRNLLIHYCILPMASSSVREKMPAIKSVLLGGPPQNGKHLLLNAICSHLGALRLTLDLSYIREPYRGKSGITMLLHLIMKTARVFQPVVVVIEEAQNILSKKVPKGFKTEYKVIKKELGKYIKKQPPTDRILFVGVTSNPAVCEVKASTKLFEKVIPVPLPSFSSRFEIIRRHLSARTGINSDAHDPQLISAIAQVTDHFSSGQLIRIVNTVVRLVEVLSKGAGDTDNGFNPKLVRLEHFVDVIRQYQPFVGKPLAAFEAWNAKLPFNKKRRLLLEDRLGLNDPPDKKKKGGAKK